MRWRQGATGGSLALVLAAALAACSREPARPVQPVPSPPAPTAASLPAPSPQPVDAEPAQCRGPPTLAPGFAGVVRCAAGSSARSYSFPSGHCLVVDGGLREVVGVQPTAGSRLLLELKTDPERTPTVGRDFQGLALVLDMERAGVVQVLEASGERSASAISPDGEWLLRGGTREPLALFNVGHHAPVWSSDSDPRVWALGPSGRWALVGGSFLEDLQGGRRRVQPVLPGTVRAAAVSQDGKLAASAGRSHGNAGAVTGWMVVWRTGDGAEVLRCEPRRKERLGPLFTAFDGCSVRDPDDLAFDRTGRKVAVAGIGGYGDVTLYDLDGGTRTLKVRTEGRIGTVAFDPQADRLLAAGGGSDGSREIRVFDAEGREVASFRHGAAVSDAAFLPGRDMVVSSSADGTTRIWDLRTGREAVRIYLWDDGSWLAVDPKGRFDGLTVDGFQGARWDSQTGASAGELVRRFHRPGLLEEILARARLP